MHSTIAALLFVLFVAGGLGATRRRRARRERGARHCHPWRRRRGRDVERRVAGHRQRRRTRGDIRWRSALRPGTAAANQQARCNGPGVRDPHRDARRRIDRHRLQRTHHRRGAHVHRSRRTARAVYGVTGGERADTGARSSRRSLRWQAARASQRSRRRCEGRRLLHCRRRVSTWARTVW